MAEIVFRSNLKLGTSPVVGGTDPVLTRNSTSGLLGATTISGTISGLTATRIPFAASASSITDDADLIFTTSTSTLSVPRVTLTPTATLAGLNVGSLAGNPSSLSTGDIWRNSSTDALMSRWTTAGSAAIVYAAATITNSILHFASNTLPGGVNASGSFTFDGSILRSPLLILTGGGTRASLQVGSIAGDASTNFANGQVWYNSSTNKFRARQAGANVTMLTTAETVAVPNGGTNLTTIAARSIWVANALDTITTVTPGAGQSIRINAGNTAWEAYTPGGGGITNGAAANELMKSDATNAVASGLFSTSSGDLQLGSGGVSGTTRFVTIAGSSANIDLNISSKGSSTVILQATTGITLKHGSGGSDVIATFGATGTHQLGNSGGDTVTLVGSTIGGSSQAFLVRAADGATNGADFTIRAGNGVTTGGDLTLTAGTGVTNGFIILQNIPTSSAGLPTGAIWSNLGVLTIV